MKSGEVDGGTAWLTFALLALGSWGVWGFLTKVVAQRVSWPMMMLMFGAASLLLGIAALPGRPRIDAAHGIGMAAGVAGAFGFFFFYRAIADGPATTVIPITSLYVAVAVVLAFVFLGEPLTVKRALGVGLAVAAVVLLAE